MSSTNENMKIKNIPLKFEIDWNIKDEDKELFEELNILFEKCWEKKKIIKYLKKMNEKLSQDDPYTRKVKKYFANIEKDKWWRYLPTSWKMLFELIYLFNIPTEQIDTIKIEGLIFESAHTLSSRYQDPKSYRDVDMELYNFFKDKLETDETWIKHIQNTPLWSIEHWHTFNMDSFEGFFKYAIFKNPNQDLSKWDTSKVTDCSSMFEKSNFNGNISKWDVSKVWTFRNMFADSWFTDKNSNFKDWKVNNWETFSWMFKNCKLHEKFSIWCWDFEKWQHFKEMFKWATYNFNLSFEAFKQKRLYFDEMFAKCKSKNIINFFAEKNQGKDIFKDKTISYKWIVAWLTPKDYILPPSFKEIDAIEKNA